MSNSQKYLPECMFFSWQMHTKNVTQNYNFFSFLGQCTTTEQTEWNHCCNECGASQQSRLAIPSHPQPVPLFAKSQKSHMSYWTPQTHRKSHHNR